MSRKKMLIIPVFLPFGGCPHRCVFCDQSGITGKSSLPSVEEVHATIRSHLSTWKGGGIPEIAFYGGSFTSLPRETQISYLEAALPHIESGDVGSVRVSTRPDSLSDESARLLKGYGVRTVELGVQSMSDEVLLLSGRGHRASDTVKAVSILKGHAMSIGAQLMPGLPGDTPDTAVMSAAEIIALKPDFARLYPTLVLRDTPLETMYRRGDFLPWGLQETVEVCRAISGLFRESGIPIIRMGLQPSAELKGRFVAGPYHPSFRQLVEAG